VVNESENVTDQFQVEEASNSGPDDFLYAPIDNAAVENDLSANEEIAILYGRFTDSCMVFKDIKVINSGKTLQVLPVIEVENRPVCQDGIFPFKRSIVLPKGMKKGRHLLHVRSLNGKSVNVMFSVFPSNP
jgi:hypothetical protein